MNQQILDACLENRSRTIVGRGMTIGQASERERELLSPLAEEGFPIHELLYPLLVDSKGRVKVRTNWYSTPLWPGLRVVSMMWARSVIRSSSVLQSRGFGNTVVHSENGKFVVMIIKWSKWATPE